MTNNEVGLLTSICDKVKWEVACPSMSSMITTNHDQGTANDWSLTTDCDQCGDERPAATDIIKDKADQAADLGLG